MRCWARSLFRSEKATEWRVVDVPFAVTERKVIVWPNRQGRGTSYEPRMEYRPPDDPPKGVDEPLWAQQAWEEVME